MKSVSNFTEKLDPGNVPIGPKGVPWVWLGCGEGAEGLPHAPPFLTEKTQLYVPSVSKVQTVPAERVEDGIAD